ncbi:hypothetical protein HHK36_000251 [Tetracentron sinense]|uniref:Uncharacterized protein n=1 Tax=Tetracentron sinense TaxID=13715 RepID=A0A834ZV62_TETSI|nr:hypothetical protein HHK36_000251 [Tetracentron sinense]
MAEETNSTTPAAKRYAVVTGANRGIGLEICRQLASNGIAVVLTARDEKRGIQAVENLKGSGFSDVVFHQLDVMNPSSIDSLEDFIRTHIGKLDILVNNAGINGIMLGIDAIRALKTAADELNGEKIKWKEISRQTYELAEECLKTNYYGTKIVTEALIPLLQLSNSPRIVNVSSGIVKSQKICNEKAREVLSDVDGLTEERVDEMLNEFLKDFKENSLETKGWPAGVSGYTVSKVAVNAYTRILAKKFPTFCINCVCPGHVKTDMTCKTGYLTAEEGAESPVRCAVVTGANKGIGLEICRQLASNGIMVVLTARDEKRGIQTVENLKGISGVILDADAIGALKTADGEKIYNEKAKEVLSDVDGLTEERVDEMLNEFLKDYKENSLETKGWPASLSGYTVSKVAMNAYTTILAKKFPTFCINCVCPGFVKTDINCKSGYLTVEEGAESPVRCAVVTGANKGIGLEICRQLASNGIMVVLTARDEKRGIEAVENLRGSGFYDVVFHQLDVMDPTSISSLKDFIKTHFGKLDILVNNAGIVGLLLDADAIGALKTADDELKAGTINWKDVSTETYELAEECLKTNYYGTKKVTEALIPFLQLSNSARIVNVSSGAVKSQKIYNEKAKEVLSDVDGLTEERVDEMLNEFLKDYKENSLETKGWPAILSGYILSKVAMNAYTRILAKKFPTFCINCVCPGFVKTDINCKSGYLTVEEGAESPVRLALLPDGGPSGLFFMRKEVASYD